MQTSASPGVDHLEDDQPPQPRGRPRALRLLAVLAAAVAALGAVWVGAQPEPALAVRTFEAPFKPDPAHPARLLVRDDLVPHLESQKVGSDTVHARVVGYGRVGFAPDASYGVRVPFASYVEKVMLGLGDEVKKGAPLLELRSSEVARLRAELRNAQVAVKTEDAALARLQRLAADGTAPERELVETRARLEVARAEADAVRESLAAAGVSPEGGDRYVLRAPAAGRVLERHVAPGERISPEADAPALRIGDPTSLVVRAAFPERDAVWLKEGAPCEVSMHALGSARFRGEITRIVRAMDPETRSIEATCTPLLDDPRVTAQMLARVEVEVTGAAKVLAPRSALLLQRDAYVVFVRVAPNALERRTVEPTLRLGEHVGIARGLADGEEVITKGAVLLDGELDRLL